jgi:tripartite-type tricarboxylate transporter receptor subunit TctC
VQAGKVRAVAVTSPKRSASLPDAPTMAEIGYPDAGADNWFGALVPAATPKDVREKLHAIFAKAFEVPDTKKYMGLQGVDVIAGSPDHFAAFLKSEYAKWQKVIRATGIKAE